MKKKSVKAFKKENQKIKLVATILTTSIISSIWFTSIPKMKLAKNILAIEKKDIGKNSSLTLTNNDVMVLHRNQSGMKFQILLNNVEVDNNHTVQIRKKETLYIKYVATSIFGNKTHIAREINCIDTQKPIISLRDNLVDSIELGDKKSEILLGISDVIIEDNSDEMYKCNVNIFVDKEVYNKQPLSSNQIRSWIVEYEAVDHSGNVSYRISREINCIDTVSPVLKVKANLPKKLYCGDEISCNIEDLEIQDESDCSLLFINVVGTDKVVEKFECKNGFVYFSKTIVDQWIFTYIIEDSNGNRNSINREISTYDDKPPEAILKSTIVKQIECGEKISFSKDDLVVTDRTETILDSVYIDNKKLTKSEYHFEIPKTYTIKYIIKDMSNLETQLVRKIEAVDTNVPTLKLANNIQKEFDCSSIIQLSNSDLIIDDGLLKANSNGTLKIKLGDTDITSITSDIPSEKTITYSFEDLSQNIAFLERTMTFRYSIEQKKARVISTDKWVKGEMSWFSFDMGKNNNRYSHPNIRFNTYFVDWEYSPQISYIVVKNIPLSNYYDSNKGLTEAFCKRENLRITNAIKQEIENKFIPVQKQYTEQMVGLWHSTSDFKKYKCDISKIEFIFVNSEFEIVDARLSNNLPPPISSYVEDAIEPESEFVRYVDGEEEFDAMYPSGMLFYIHGMNDWSMKYPANYPEDKFEIDSIYFENLPESSFDPSRFGNLDKDVAPNKKWLKFNDCEGYYLLCEQIQSGFRYTNNGGKFKFKLKYVKYTGDFSRWYSA